ncbi:glycosyltransferase, partial [Candidatus Uhrbacteria bacterium]|nr:glycosyltransferase [Candidatus Uhrbacteria bacterium]
DVIELGYVAPEHMAHLYSASAAFVFPSWYEGFGLPVLEAWACGTPVIASRAASLPEVCADACHFIDPAREETLTAALGMILTDEDTRARLVESGRLRLQDFSWKKTAELTWRALEAELAKS